MKFEQRAFTGENIFNKELIKLSKMSDYFFHYAACYLVMAQN